MKDEVLNEVMKELIVSEKDFEKYFKKKNILLCNFIISYT